MPSKLADDGGKSSDLKTLRLLLAAGTDFRNDPKKSSFGLLYAGATDLAAAIAPVLLVGARTQNRGLGITRVWQKALQGIAACVW